MHAVQKFHPAWIEISRTQFLKNLQAIRKKIGQARFCLPVKANAYGHGLIQMSRFAEEAGLIDYFGVAYLNEAIALRQAGIQSPILVFGAIHEDQIESLLNLQVSFTISSRYKAERVATKCRELNKVCRVHVEVETGMQRTGVRPDSVHSLFNYLEASPWFRIEGVYSHLATADTPDDLGTQKQISLFQSLREEFKHREWIWHLANSGGVLYYPQAHFDMVRPGLLAYGYYPDGSQNTEEVIAPCLELKAKVSYFKVVASDLGISYGHLYKTKQQTRVITIPIGHADGYRRSLSNKAPLLLRGNKFVAAGVICMDQFMADIGQFEGYVGDEVVLIGKQKDQEITLWEVSLLAGSIPHEFLVSLGERLPRIYRS